MARRFYLVRDDHDVVNSAGQVAEGILFSSGKVALNWIAKPSSLQTFDSMADLMAVQDRNGITRVQWQDSEPQSTARVTPRSEKLRRLDESMRAILGSEPVQVRSEGHSVLVLASHR